MAEGGIKSNKYEIVTSFDRAKKIISYLACEKKIALDLEGECLGPKGTLSLVSIGDPKGNIYIIDVFGESAKTIPADKDFKQILESNTVEKVIHSSINDSAQLWRYGIRLSNVFDTQAFQEAIDNHIQSYPPPKKKNIVELCEQYGIAFGEKLQKTQIKAAMSRKVTARCAKWSSSTAFILERPLSCQVYQYAAADVKYLLELKTRMERHLETTYREADQALIRTRYEQLRDINLTKKRC